MAEPARSAENLRTTRSCGCNEDGGGLGSTIDRDDERAASKSGGRHPGAHGLSKMRFQHASREIVERQAGSFVGRIAKGRPIGFRDHQH